MVLSAAIKQPSRIEVRASHGLSFILHAAAIAVVLAIPLKATRLSEPQEPIPVTIIPSEPIAPPAPAVPGPAESIRPDEPSTVGEPVKLPALSFAMVGNMVRPSRLLSETVLADPRSVKVRRALGAMRADEKKIQLCNLEAMAQINAWKAGLQPQAVVAYAYGYPRIAGTMVDAAGAAFFTGSAWYRLNYQCEGDGEKVATFLFQVGATIPRQEWEDRSLPSVVKTEVD